LHLHPCEMFINTDAANQSTRPHGVVDNSTRQPEEPTTSLETFVGQDAPPTYLEATTPMPWNGRASEDEGAGLLRGWSSLAPSRNEEHKDGRYHKKSIRERISQNRLLIGIVAVLSAVIFIVIVIVAAPRYETKVRGSVFVR
jgi:hypothetical protein